MTTSALRAQAEAVLQRAHETIPLTQAMQLQLGDWDGQTLSLTLPLHGNHNDKGTAFAGSLTALGCIAGWTLLTLWAEQKFGACQVAVTEASFEFREAVREDFCVVVSLPNESELRIAEKALSSHRRARVALNLRLGSGESDAVTVTACYALWRV